MVEKPPLSGLIKDTVCYSLCLAVNLKAYIFKISLLQHNNSVYRVTFYFGRKVARVLLFSQIKDHTASKNSFISSR